MRMTRSMTIGLALSLIAGAGLAQRNVGGRAQMPRCTGDRCSTSSGWMVGVGAIQPNPVAKNAAAINDIANPDWIQLPVVASHYPERAFQQKASGMVLLHCTVRDDGYLEGCSVTSETPANLGFRKAALDMVPLYQMRRSTSAGDPVEGKTVSVPIVFDLPAS